MAKRLLEDMIKTKYSKKMVIQNMNIPKITPAREIPRSKTKPENINQTNKSRYMLWFLALVSVTICFFAFSFLFSRANISVNPKIKEVNINENLSALKESSDDSMSFDLVVISGEAEEKAQATSEKDVQEVATGTVILYNAFSSSPQTLNIDTRLEGSNGKIYKTKTKTTVPGMIKSNMPGSVEVSIYGAEAGEGYNSGPLDFKMFGFKGTPKYTKFYGRSKGAIAGGFKGKAPAITDTDRAQAISKLKNNLQVKLLKQAVDQIPAGFILYKDAVFLDVPDANISSTYEANDIIAFNTKGTLYGILLDEQKLTQKIFEDNLEKTDSRDAFIPNIKDLKFTLSNKENISLSDAKNINFTLTGLAKIVFKLNVEKFTNDLLGKTKKDFNQILSQYENIDSATLKLSPFWKTSIPEQSKNIKVIVNYPL